MNNGEVFSIGPIRAYQQEKRGHRMLRVFGRINTQKGQRGLDLTVFEAKMLHDWLGKQLMTVPNPLPDGGK